MCQCWLPNTNINDTKHETPLRYLNYHTPELPSAQRAPATLPLCTSQLYPTAGPSRGASSATTTTALQGDDSSGDGLLRRSPSPSISGGSPAIRVCVSVQVQVQVQVPNLREKGSLTRTWSPAVSSTMSFTSSTLVGPAARDPLMRSPPLPLTDEEQIWRHVRHQTNRQPRAKQTAASW